MLALPYPLLRQVEVSQAEHHQEEEEAEEAVLPSLEGEEEEVVVVEASCRVVFERNMKLGSSGHHYHYASSLS